MTQYGKWVVGKVVGNWDQKKDVENNKKYDGMCEKCCEGVSKQNRKSKSFRFQECFGRGVQTESKRGKRNAAENHERAATYGPSKTMYTCRQSSARQHRSSRAAGIHDDISTPGGRWASHGGGGASDVDAPGSNLNYIENELPASYSRESC